MDFFFKEFKKGVSLCVWMFWKRMRCNLFDNLTSRELLAYLTQVTSQTFSEIINVNILFIKFIYFSFVYSHYQHELQLEHPLV